jgi:Protein of unknown function (DUF2934)
MTQPTEEEIKKRAYEIWERHGRPEGKKDEFWQQAEQELRNEDKSSPIRTPDTLYTNERLATMQRYAGWLSLAVAARSFFFARIRSEPNRMVHCATDSSKDS